MLKQIIDGFAVSLFAMFTLCVLVIIPIYWYGPSYETRYYPVVIDYKATPILNRGDLDPNFAWYTITFNKVRSCSAIDTFEWYVIDPTGQAVRVDAKSSTNIQPGDPAQVPIQQYLDTSPTTPPRPLGPNKIPAYRVDSLRYAPYVSQKLVMTYHCHPFWTTLTEINIPIGSEIYGK